VRRTLYLIVGIVLVTYGWHHYQHRQLAALDGAEPGHGSVAPSVEPDTPDASYHCDGRVYCSQMHSCEEATWFLQHCAGMKMDGDRDGVPCERQWCE
jgi:hypothetical protein